MRVVDDFRYWAHGVAFLIKHAPGKEGSGNAFIDQASGNYGTTVPLPGWHMSEGTGNASMPNAGCDICLPCLQVWRPLKGPVNEAPLAVVESGTVSKEALHTVKLEFPHRTGYTYSVSHEPGVFPGLL